MVNPAPRHVPTAARRLVVRTHRDDATGGWWADSDDIPGLVTEAATLDDLMERVIAVVPDVCKANNVAISSGDVLEFRKVGAGLSMTKAELEKALSELAEKMSEALQHDDYVVDRLHELAEAKLALDGVDRKQSELTEDAALAIFNDTDPDHPEIVRPREFVPSSESAKNSHFNLALQWILNQALARVQIGYHFASEVERSDT